MIANLSPEDLANIQHLQVKDWPDILPPFAYYLRSNYCLALKAQMGEKIVGLGAGILYGRSGWLAHIVVDPAERKRGIGTRISQSLAETLEKQGCKTLLLTATALGEPIYRKIGFEIDTPIHFFQGKAATPGLNPHIWGFHPSYTAFCFRWIRPLAEKTGKNYLALTSPTPSCI
ncbi:MAG: GNAT family N-acetyltransferase [Bacteroidia bacterium]|nr:GNAT family N-acetyltransferase [Bacteroidia bacterium]